jgi:hypothetical protein
MLTHPVALQHRDGCSCRCNLPAHGILVRIAQRQVRTKGILWKTMPCRSPMTQPSRRRGGGLDLHVQDRNKHTCVHTYPGMLQPCNGTSRPLYITAQCCLVRIRSSQVGAKGELPNDINSKEKIAVDSSRCRLAGEAVKQTQRRREGRLRQ